LAPRTASLTTRLLLASLSTLLALVAVEATARLADPHRIDGLNMSAFTRPATRPGQMTELIPGATNDHFLGGPVRINADGLRGAPLLEDSASERFVAVGDSVTFGYGVREEDTWIAQLSAELADLGHPMEPVNAGLSGAGLRYYHSFLQRRCSELAPDRVLVGLVINDIATYPEDTATAEKPVHRRRLGAQLNHALMTHSHVYTASVPLAKGLAYRTGLLDLNDNPGFAFVALDSPSPAQQSAWDSSLSLLDDIADEVDRCGARFTLVMFPVETQLSEDALRLYRDGLGVHIADTAMNGEPQERVRAWASARGVDFVDLLPDFRAQHTAEDSLFLRSDVVAIDPVHLSARGNAVTAGVLASHFTARRQGAVAEVVP